MKKLASKNSISIRQKHADWVKNQKKNGISASKPSNPIDC